MVTLITLFALCSIYGVYRLLLGSDFGTEESVMILYVMALILLVIVIIK